MNPLTNSVAGPVVDVDGRVELLDAAVVHDGDAVGDAHRLVLVVRDQDRGQSELALQPLDLDLHVEAQALVERAERLVEQQHATARQPSARASATRCCWPPDSCRGSRSAKPPS